MGLRISASRSPLQDLRCRILKRYEFSGDGKTKSKLLRNVFGYELAARILAGITVGRQT